MNRETLVLLVMFGVLGMVLGLVVVLIVDAMVLQPPDVDTTLKVSGAVQ